MFRTLVLVAFAQGMAIAAPQPSYLFEMEIYRQGQKSDSNQILLQEGRDGIISSSTGPKEHATFSASLHSVHNDAIKISYHVTEEKGPSSIDFAKSDVQLKANEPEILHLQDNVGDPIEIRISVQKQ